MNLKICITFFFLFLLGFSCMEQMEEPIDRAKTKELLYEDRFLVNELGDTILTGRPIPTAGKRINPDSIPSPWVFPLDQPETAPAYTNILTVNKMRVTQISEILPVVAPGKNGVPLPKTVPARGKAAPTRQPKPVLALPPRMKDAAIYDIQYLDVDQGMASSYVLSILEDSRGNLWFGTEGGASRFDGRSFTHYTTEQGLSDNTVHSILEDRQGNLWFGTRDGGVNRYDGQSFIHYTTKEGLVHNFIRTMLEDSLGNLWFGTFGGGVSLYEPADRDRDGTKGASFTHYTVEEGLNGNLVSSCLFDSQKNLWFATYRGLSRYDGQSFTNYTYKEGLIPNRVDDIQEDGWGNLWLGSWSQVICFNPAGSGTFTNYTAEEEFDGAYFLSIVKDRKENLWFGNSKGQLSRYDPADNPWDDRDGPDSISFTHFTPEKGLSENAVEAILEDSWGNLWFGTYGDGVGRYKSPGFIQYTTEEGLIRNTVRFMLADSLGNLWFGAWDGGVSRYTPDSDDQERGRFSHFGTEGGDIIRSSIYGQSILKDSRGHLWFGTGEESGIIRYNGLNCIRFETSQHLTNRTLSMLEDSRGDLWFGTFDNGASRFEFNPNYPGWGSYTHFTTREGLSNNKVWSILEDSQKNLWFGTGGGGASRYEPDLVNPGRDSITHFTTKEGLSNNTVKSILEDSQGRLWFGTENGLNRYDPAGTGTFIHYTTEEGLSNNSIKSILEDKQKNIWISTDQGITLLKPVAAADSKIDDYQCFTFGKEDGLKKTDFEVNSVCLDRFNRIWWGSQGGLTMLDLNKFELPTEPPKNVQLTHIELQQQFVDYRRLADTAYSNKFSFGKELNQSFDSVVSFYNYPIHMTLPYDLNHLTFYFSAIDWAAPHKIQYSYWMEGLDNNWSIPQLEPKVDYRNLPYGNFTFKLRAIGAAKIWSETFEYTFSIRPPWWQTWWARCLWIGLFLGISYWFYRFQLNRRLAIAEAHRLRELDQIKTRLYTNITHEFRTPLTIINGIAGQLQNQVSQSAGKGLKMIIRNGRQLLRLVNQMLDLAKLESGTLPVNKVQGDVIPYLRYLAESFHSYAKSKGLSLHFHTDLEEFVMDYDREKILHIVSNLLSNAIKFTPSNGTIELQITKVVNGLSAFLEIKVKDSGLGIAPDQLPRIFSRFFQEDTSPTRQNEGTGIGLTLVKELAQLLGGDIKVSSELGAGSTFKVLLPADKAPSTAAAPDRFDELKPVIQAFAQEKNPDIIKGQPKPPPADPNKPRLLIVEDNQDIIQYLTSCLESFYQLITAENGRIGIEKAIELTPDIIISDVMMPEKDGFEVCETLKLDERTSHIPIILLTAKADVESRIVGLKRGADAYLAKPFNQRELLVRLQMLIEMRQKLQARYQKLSPEAPAEDLAQAMEDAFLQKVRAAIEKNLPGGKLSVADMAKELTLSRSQFYRKINALTGQTAAHFILRVRLQYAKGLLETTGFKISVIAYDVGFSDPSYFAKTFREEYGILPSDVQRK